jgi:hypothetical protein
MDFLCPEMRRWIFFLGEEVLAPNLPEVGKEASGRFAALTEALPSGVERLLLRKLELEQVDAMVEEEVRRISVLIERVNLYAKLGRGTHNNQKEATLHSDACGKKANEGKQRRKKAHCDSEIT